MRETVSDEHAVSMRWCGMPQFLRTAATSSNATGLRNRTRPTNTSFNALVRETVSENSSNLSNATGAENSSNSSNVTGLRNRTHPTNTSFKALVRETVSENSSNLSNATGAENSSKSSNATGVRSRTHPTNTSFNASVWETVSENSSNLSNATGAENSSKSSNATGVRNRTHPTNTRFTATVRGKVSENSSNLSNVAEGERSCNSSGTYPMSSTTTVTRSWTNLKNNSVLESILLDVELGKQENHTWSEQQGETLLIQLQSVFNEMLETDEPVDDGILRDLMAVPEVLAGSPQAELSGDLIVELAIAVGDIASVGLVEDEVRSVASPGGSELSVVAPSTGSLSTGFVLGAFDVPPLPYVGVAGWRTRGALGPPLRPCRSQVSIHYTQTEEKAFPSSCTFHVRDSHGMSLCGARGACVCRVLLLDALCE